MLDSHWTKPHFGLGQGLSEYALIGAVFLLALIPAIMLLGGNLRDAYSSMLPARKPVTVASAPSVGNDTSPPPEAPASPSVPATASPSPPASGGNVKLKLPDGTTLELNIPPDLPQSIQTVGANGTTEMLAVSLEQLAQQLLDEQKIDQNEANAILALANQGHKMAAIEKAIEQASLANGSDLDGFMATAITIDGKTYASPYEAAKAIGIVGDTENKGPELQKFWDLYTGATSATWDASPEVKAILEYNTFAIHDIADGLRVSMENMVIYNNGSTPADLADGAASEVSHGNSGSICNLKVGNQDSGIHCSG